MVILPESLPGEFCQWLRWKLLALLPTRWDVQHLFALLQTKKPSSFLPVSHENLYETSLGVVQTCLYGHGAVEGSVLCCPYAGTARSLHKKFTFHSALSPGQQLMQRGAGFHTSLEETKMVR